MGLRGLPLCELSFQNSEGFLLGDDLDQAIETLATLSLHSRFHGSISGVAVAEKAFQASLKYSQQRRANRSPPPPPLTSLLTLLRAIVRSPKILLPADPIVVHPDVRRMLLIQKAIAEGGRSMLLEHALKIDQVPSLLALTC
jgi:alkylation response protein AidB-like acyl-CoA dehydrogenase